MEKIIYAAIKHEGDILKSKKSHSDIGSPYIAEPDSSFGFVTDTGRFVSRQEAAEIAFNAGQINTKLKTLASQDIFN